MSRVRWRPRMRTLLAVVFVPLVAVAAAGAIPEEGVVVDHGAVAVSTAETPDADERLSELSRQLEELLAIVAAERPDALSIPEAEEMGIVAEELRQEGDSDLAAILLGEAIALLEEEGG